MPSVLAAAALYWASCISSPGAAPSSSFVFFEVTGYQPEILCRCVRNMGAAHTEGGGTGRRDGGLGLVGPVLHCPSTRGRPWSVRKVATLPSPRFKAPGHARRSLRNKSVTGACGQSVYGGLLMDSDQEMELFDVESFVDHLVEEDPPAKAAYICDAPVAADTPPEMVTKSGNSHLCC